MNWAHLKNTKEFGLVLVFGRCVICTVFCSISVWYLLELTSMSVELTHISFQDPFAFSLCVLESRAWSARSLTWTVRYTPGTTPLTHARSILSQMLEDVGQQETLPFLCYHPQISPRLLERSLMTDWVKAPLPFTSAWRCSRLTPSTKISKLMTTSDDKLCAAVDSTGSAISPVVKCGKRCQPNQSMSWCTLSLPA